jgi:3-hydroxyacyl-[acyl-carrier-protein] dehydratase
LALNIDQVLDYLPHRPPFLLLDSVDEVVPGEHIVGRKNVSANEPYLQGHFPGYPIMPGVMIIEALAQVCSVLASKTVGKKPSDGDLHYLVGLDGVRFKRKVRPGDVLELHSSIVNQRRNLMKLDCKALVEGELACSATLLCMVGEATS